MSEKVKKIPNRRGDALPMDGYGLAVDGKIKSHHITSESALKAGLEIKRNYPVVQVMVFDALEPRRLSRRAKQALAEGTESRSLACSDICLWELAMLAARGKIDARGDTAAFINDLLQARYIRTLPITPEIAVLAQSDAFRHGDPADRLEPRPRSNTASRSSLRMPNCASCGSSRPSGSEEVYITQSPINSSRRRGI